MNLHDQLRGAQALSFDLDGTLASIAWRKIGLVPLVARHPRIFAAYPAVFRHLRNRRVPDVRVALAEGIAQQTRIEHHEVAAVLAQVLDHEWPAQFEGARPSPAVQAAIRWCDTNGHPRVVVSDYPGLAKLRHMQSTGWAAVIDCGALGALKPHPDGLIAASAQLGIAPPHLVHIGDRWDTDGAAAAAAGCRFIHVDRLGSLEPDQTKP